MPAKIPIVPTYMRVVDEARAPGVVGHMMLDMSKQCLNCANLSKDGPMCRAFPGGIPNQIRLGEFDHRSHFPGDGGILFLPKPKARWPTE